MGFSKCAPHGDSVVIRVSERSSKLPSKFVGPCELVKCLGGHKYQVHDPNSSSFEIVHNDRLKKTSARFEADRLPSDEIVDISKESNYSTSTSPTPLPHFCNLRKRN